MYAILNHPNQSSTRLTFRTKTRFLLTASLLFWLGLAGIFPAYSAQERSLTDIAASLVRIRVVKNIYPGHQPYAQPEIREVHGSGFLVEGNLILTDIELVRNAISISLKNPNSGVTYRAAVQHLGFDCGLAVLSLQENDEKKTQFLKNRKFLKVSGEGAPVSARLDLAGVAGDGSVILQQATLGQVAEALIDGSDVDYHRLLYLQKDERAPGAMYSGGPAFYKDKLIGLFHYSNDSTGKHKRKNKNNKGRSYIIHGETINHLLLDIRDNRYDGFPNPGFYYSALENAEHRKILGLAPEDGGVLIRRLAFQSSAGGYLSPGDVLLNVDDKNINSQGEIVDGREVLTLERYLARKQATVINLKVRRGGKTIGVNMPLRSYPGFRWKRRDVSGKQSYFLSAGLVFQELDYELMRETPAGENLVLRYRYNYFHEDLLSEQVDRDVVLTAVLDDPANAGAGEFVFMIVDYINDRRIRNLADFEKEWNSAQSELMVIYFRGRSVPLVLRREEMEAANRRIYSKYKIKESGRVQN